MRTYITFNGYPTSFKKVIDLATIPSVGEAVRFNPPTEGPLLNGYVTERRFEESVSGGLAVDGHNEDGSPRLVALGDPEMVCHLEVQEA